MDAHRSLLVLVLLAIVSGCQGSRILMTVLFGSKSHKNVFTPLAEALVARGHEITFISPFMPSKKTKGINEIAPKLLQAAGANLEHDAVSKKERGETEMFTVLRDAVADCCNATFSSPEIRDLLNSGTRFDLVVVDGFMGDCALGFVHYYNVPFIYLNSPGFFPWQALATGNPHPLSYIPSTPTSHTDSMTFFQRVKNLLMEGVFTYFHDYMVMPAAEEVLKVLLKGGIPPLKEVEAKHLSLSLMNRHFSMEYPRPFLPNLIEVAGMHCSPGKPLPQDLEDFVSGSGDEGFIYFSLGSVATSLPDKYRRIFLEAFRHLPQRVIWKYQSNTMENLPDNVKLGTWLPQQDILAHPKLKLFITHGGLLSMQEAVYYGVPVLVLPVFGDQPVNAQKAEQQMYGKQMEIVGITSKELQKGIKEVVADPRYKQNAMYRSALLRDQPDHPLDRAVFWTEYVLRHNGAYHLRSAALQLSWFQYWMLDVLAFCILVLYLVMRIICFPIRWCYGKLRGSRKSKKD